MVNTKSYSSDVEVVSVKSGPYELKIAVMQQSNRMYELVDITVNKTRPAVLSSKRFIDESNIPAFFEVASVEQIKRDIKKSVANL